MKIVKVLKVMLADGRIIGYRLKRQDIQAVQMIGMSEGDAKEYEDGNKPDVQTLFQNEGHLTVRA